MQKEGEKCGRPTKVKQLRIKGKIISVMGSSGDEIHSTCKRIISKIQNAESGKPKDVLGFVLYTKLNPGPAGNCALARVQVLCI